ncbi:MAG TPA: sensor histidine kinase [Anaerolineae bacterium]|nr:sensor histidine kinase [Anaerolineae bacterium]
MNPLVKSSHGGLITIYVTSTAFTITTLAVQTTLWSDGRWLIYLAGAVLFTLIAHAAALVDRRRLRLFVLLLIVQAVLLLGLIHLANYYFLTAMLSFITVSLAQSNLSPRWGNLFSLVLLAAIAAWYGVMGGWEGVWQISLGLGAGFVFITAFTRVADNERLARQQLEAANRQLAEYAAEVEQLATMRERNRLARDVHDSLGHYLTVINVQLEVVTKLIASDPARAREAAVKAKELASEGLAEVRRSVAALRPSPLDDRPLPDTIRQLVDTTRDTGLLVTFEQRGATRPLAAETETTLYRTAQEALTNIRKHAHASSASVRLVFEPAAVRLCIRDNGIGRHDSEDQVGLSALRERAAALNGSVLAENHAEGGFLLEVTLPIAHYEGIV